MKNKSILMVLIFGLALGLLIFIAGCEDRSVRTQHLGTREKSAEAPLLAAEAVVNDKARSEPITERKLIARITLTLEVEKIKGSVERAEAIAKEFGGYVSDSRIYQEETSESATLVLMIPIQNLEQAVAKIRELGKVRYEQKTTEDVTRQFIDNQARIQNLQREEEALTELLKRTGKLSEILEVERELARVRTEIESLQGELRYLEHQTSYSTLTLNLTTKPLPGKYEGRPLKNAFVNAWHAFRATLHGLAVLAIYACFFLPLILILLLFIYLLLRFIIRRLRRGAKSIGS